MRAQVKLIQVELSLRWSMIPSPSAQLRPSDREGIRIADRSHVQCLIHIGLNIDEHVPFDFCLFTLDLGLFFLHGPRSLVEALLFLEVLRVFIVVILGFPDIVKL